MFMVINKSNVGEMEKTGYMIRFVENRKIVNVRGGNLGTLKQLVNEYNFMQLKLGTNIITVWNE